MVVMAHIAFLFPGQGSQYVGMGKELFENFPSARMVFEEADEVLGWKISNLCFEGPEEKLRLTENTQPALLTVSTAAFRVLGEETAIRPDILAGHSLGEITALTAAGAFSFDTALRLAKLRGRLMQEAVPLGKGAMAAILGLEKEEVEQICREAAQGEVVSPANFNASGQIVISGNSSAVERAIAKAKEHGAKKVILLPVSAPFHCPLMKGASECFEKALEDINVQRPKWPIISNAEAKSYFSEHIVKPLLVKQMEQPVKWEESMREMVRLGVERALEIGPGKVLSALMKRIDGSVTLGNLEDMKSFRKTLEIFT